MEFNTFCTNVCGLPAGGVWSQVFFWENFFGLVSIYTDEENIGVKGKELISLLEGTRVENLADFLAKMEEVVGSFLEDGVRVVLAAGFLKDKVLYLVTNGGEIYLKREGKLGKLVEKETDGILVGASGYINDGDLVVLASRLFGRIVGKGKFEEALDGGIGEFRDKFMPIIGGSEDGAEAVAMAVRFEKREEDFNEVEKGEDFKREILAKKGVEIKKFLIGVKSKIEKKGRLILLARRRLGFLRRGTKERKGVEGYKIVVGVKSNKTLYSLILVVGLLLLGSIFFSFSQRGKGKDEKYREVLKKAEMSYEEGKALVDLNPVRAKTLLVLAKEDLADVGKKVDKGWEKIKREELAKKIEEELLGVGGVKKARAKNFLDLSLLKKEIKAEKVVSYGDRLIVWDGKNGSVVAVEKKTKKAEIIGGGKKVKGGSVFGFYGGKFYVLTDKGVYEGEEGRKRIAGVIGVDDDWGEIISMFGYAGNLYLLDKKGKIYKYVRLDEGFGEKADYLAKEALVDFSKAIKMVIDGAVWVATDEGEIFKFLRGNPEQFAYLQFEGEIRDVVDFYTDENLENIYILDKGGNRILVFDKKGLFEAEYEVENKTGAIGVAADEELKKIFLLSRTKLYEVKIAN